MIFNAIFGWTNSATYGSVIGYVMYWVAVMGALGGLKWKEVRFVSHFLPLYPASQPYLSKEELVVAVRIEWC